MFASVDMNKNYLYIYIYIFMSVLCQRDNVRTLTPSGRYPNENIPTLFNYTLGYIRVLWDSIQKKHQKTIPSQGFSFRVCGSKPDPISFLDV